MTNPEAEAILYAALMDDVPPNQHGQLCPVWTRRKYPRKGAECDCWQTARARRVAIRLAAALALTEAVSS